MELIEVVNWLEKQGVVRNERTGHIDISNKTLQKTGLNTLRFNFIVEFNKNSS